MPARRRTIKADVITQSPLWKAEPKARAIIRAAIEEAAAAVSTFGGELAIVLTDDSTMRALNRDWRGIDKPTNVLSFPQARGAAEAAPVMLGDIVIAHETTAREAQEQHKRFAHHLAHLAVHGFLHLVGHDHENDAEADDMEALEVAILARLDIPDPYAARDATADI
jgi:probable rRNA maturation factor